MILKNTVSLWVALGAAVFVIPPMCARADAQHSPNALTDAQISQIVRTANDGEIRQAEFAMQHTDQPKIKQFAEMMIDQHSDANQSINAVDSTEGISPQKSATSLKLKHEADQKLSQLKKLKGNDLDQAYVASQVMAHQAVLNDLDHKLIPSAKDAKLQAALKQIRPTVQMHLEHAKRLQAELSLSNGGGSGVPGTG